MSRVLIVEDDDSSAEALAAIVEAEGHDCRRARSLAQARAALAKEPAEAILLDLELPDGRGLALFEDAALRGEAAIVLVTGHASVESSVAALRLGAADYLIKPVEPRRLLNVLARIAAAPVRSDDVRHAIDEAERTGRFGRLIGRSPVMLDVYRSLGRVADTAVNVLLVGESGTGKEAAAQTLHELSRRRDGPFLAVNCGAISPQLIESELFGHEKGSFTGAVRQHRGHFERSDGGTLFLDEITEMPMELQVKLLRVLETGAFQRVGSDHAIRTDVRIVAATNRAPREAVAQRRLREDLYYRLAVFQVDLPALRVRLEDVPAIATHFLDRFCADHGRDPMLFAASAFDRASRHAWPGNVRELRNLVQRAAIMADGDTIRDLPVPGADGLVRDAPGSYRTTSVDADVLVEIPLGTSLERAERLVIDATLARCEGVRQRAADVLGISIKTLYNRLRETRGGSEL
jgi:DNA-binding NtrC family response regulator